MGTKIKQLMVLAALLVLMPVDQAHAFCIGPIIKEIKALAQHPLVVESVKKGNAKGLTLEQIKEIDERWIQQKGKVPEAQAMLESTVSKLLALELAQKIYLKEAILTGRLGENVAMSPTTTDYWQGDEEKYLAVFDENIPPSKPDQIISRAKWDESSRAMIAKVSVGVFDGPRMIGTLTVGVDLKRVPQTH